MAQRVVFGVGHARRIVLIIALVVPLKLQREPHMLDLGLRFCEFCDVDQRFFRFCSFLSRFASARKLLDALYPIARDNLTPNFIHWRKGESGKVSIYASLVQFDLFAFAVYLRRELNGHTLLRNQCGNE